MYTFLGVLGSSRGPLGFSLTPGVQKLGAFVQRALWSGFLRSSEKFADRPALFAGGKFLKYSELRAGACRVAATIQAHVDPSETTLTAVFAYRSPTAFIGVLGSLLAGNGYVPLNRTFPIERTQVMLERSGCRSIVVDEGSLPQLNKLLETASAPLLVLTPDALDFASTNSSGHNTLFLRVTNSSPLKAGGSRLSNPIPSPISCLLPAAPAFPKALP